MNVYLLDYNNYYNRIVKRLDNITDYQDYILTLVQGVNFNPNDGVDTELIINYLDETYPDYLIVTDRDNQIMHRWFINDAIRTRAGQYKLKLHRDLVADYYDQITTSPVYIEKATLDAGNPLIYNSENFSVNQIKTSETLLKDGSGCPWIVGYYAKNTDADHLKGTVDANDLDKAYDEEITTTFAAWKYNATTTPYTGLFDTLDYRVYASAVSTDIGSSQYPAYFAFDRYGNYIGLSNRASNNSGLTVPNYGGYSVGPSLQPEFRAQSSHLISFVPNYIAVNSDDDVRKFLNYNGKVIKDTKGKYYSITITKNEEFDEAVVDIQSGNLFNAIDDIVSQSAYISGTANAASYKVYYRRPKYTMLATELTGLETTWDISGSKLITDDAPYNLFAIPYGDTSLEYLGNTVATSNAIIGMAVANSIIRTMGNNLYDIQLLPYCPVSTPFSNGVLQMYDTDAYSIVKTPSGDTLENHIGYILNVSKSKFSHNLDYKLDAPETAIEKKVSNECDKYRISSPNYNGYFDFSVAKNNGVDYFNVDCEYKPFQPYIHINPNFKGLYGQDFNDARGLICNGDFSLTQLRDEWQQYQIQNKNYQEIFSRQIEHIDFNNRMQNIADITSAAVGTVGGIAGGAAASSAFGVGMIPGAIVGGALSAAGGAADVLLSRQIREEALDYTKDNFGYQLGNIQALPYTLTKVSAFNNNNKLFPFIEYYTCTDVEKEAFRNKLKYNGMTVMAVGYIRDYLRSEPTYIKGKLIRIEGISDDYHVINELAKEINKGVYI